MEPIAPSSSVGTIDEVIDRRLVRAVFQPIVDLDTGETVAFEALARGPAGTPFESPAALFPAAAGVGRVTELDWTCRAAAYRVFGEAGFPRSVPLFVNSEPGTLGSECPGDLRPTVDRAVETLRTVIELTERELTADPARLLDAIRRARGAGRAIALDDVGADPDSLAIMPFVGPDVVKLDLSLIQGRTDLEVAKVITAVLAHAERTGASVLAEGIETLEHRDLARSFGARYGQGWLFGRPGPLPAGVTEPSRPIPVLEIPVQERVASPFDLVTAHRPPRRATKRTLLALSLHIENGGLDTNDRPVLLACLQDVRYLTPATKERYARLARSAAFVAALGSGVPPAPLPGVRGAALRRGDRLEGEWHVLVVGPHTAAGLLARDLGDDGPDLDRRFDYVITHDRDLVVAAAAALMGRIEPS